jgi:hypothetical protein
MLTCSGQLVRHRTAPHAERESQYSTIQQTSELTNSVSVSFEGKTEDVGAVTS